MGYGPPNTFALVFVDRRIKRIVRLSAGCTVAASATTWFTDHRILLKTEHFHFESLYPAENLPKLVESMQNPFGSPPVLDGGESVVAVVGQ